MALNQMSLLHVHVCVAGDEGEDDWSESVCQVAVVLLVALSTCPETGSEDPDMSIRMSPSAATSVLAAIFEELSIIVLFVNV